MARLKFQTIRKPIVMGKMQGPGRTPTSHGLFTDETQSGFINKASATNRNEQMAAEGGEKVHTPV